MASVEKRIVISPVDGDILVRSNSFYFFNLIFVFVASRMSRNWGHVKWCLLRMLKCRLCVTNSMHCRSSINSSTHRNYSSVAYTPITVYRCRAAEPRNQIVRTSFEKIAFLNYNRHCLIMWRLSGLKFTGGGLILSSRGTKQILMFSRVKNVTFTPFCKTECFDYILAS